MDEFLYTGANTGQISFPLGGLGTGCIGLAGNGRLIDWEIFNRPNKGSTNGFSHFAIKAESVTGELVDARVLHGDLATSLSGTLDGPKYRSFGFGPPREYLTGMPHFESVAFRGEFPLAELDFLGAPFPGQVRLQAFNPFIPLNEQDSGIPAAFFEFHLANTTSDPLDYTLAGVVANPFEKDRRNTVRRQGDHHLLHLGIEGLAPGDPAYGDLTLATDAERVSWQQYWFRGAWFDSLEVYWRDLTTPGRFENRAYAAGDAVQSTGAYRGHDEGLLAAHLRLEPGETSSVRFIISWNFPVCENYWNEGARSRAEEAGLPLTWKNFYATCWEDSQASAAYGLEHWDRLYDGTRRFKDALFASDLPAPALDAVSANLAILKTPTVQRLEDGTFYGWEGGHPHEGCCEGSCTHVWNYAQALPFLFPKLERSLRESDYRFNQRSSGGMDFRMMLPLGTPPVGGGVVGRPCADGQFGGVMKTYRDWKICGDTGWLRTLWPAVKASIAFAWHPDNADRWDPDQTGVLWGRQHHTLDMELFGPNAWLTGFYLGALKAGAEMAEALGEADTTAEYREIFERGKAWIDGHLFNGEYYQQLIDLEDRRQLERFDGGAAVRAYWNEEHQEVKYQSGEGCAIDQLLAQWHANLYGLGELFDPEQTRTAVGSVFRHNFKTSSRDSYNSQRIYSLNDEGGLVICVWPEGRHQPVIPLPYGHETMHGFEYAAAALMLQNGLIDEGVTVVKAVRDRYDGEKRNPWNELECGSNYARSMAAYALLNTFAGFEFDLTREMIGFDPLLPVARSFRSFWSLDSGWGEVVITPQQVELRLHSGRLRLRTLRLPFASAVLEASSGGDSLTFGWQDGALEFDDSVDIEQGQTLRLRLG